MTITVPTFVIFAPALVLWMVGYLVVANAEWNRRFDDMISSDDDLTPQRFALNLAATATLAFFWPVVLVVATVKGSAS